MNEWMADLLNVSLTEVCDKEHLNNKEWAKCGHHDIEYSYVA